MRLVTVLQLVRLDPTPPPPPPSSSSRTSQAPTAEDQKSESNPKPKFYIQSQNDLYQANQLVKLLSPLGLASAVLLVVQGLATLGCVLGAVVGWPVSWVEENVLGKRQERSVREALVG